MSHPQLPYRPQQPSPEQPPIVIDPWTGYPPVQAPYPAPRSTYSRPAASRTPLAKRLMLGVIVIVLGFIALTYLKGQRWVSFSGREAWWVGSWVADNGEDVPRLELQGWGTGVRGQLIVAYTPGYLASLPFNGEAVGDSILFCVQEQSPSVPNVRQSRGLSYYLLRWQAPGICHLYRLADLPPNRPYSAGLIPRSLDTEHTLVARLTRPFPAATLRPDTPPASQAPVPGKESPREP